MRTVYLSGPITGLDYKGCTDWREYARTWLADLNIEGLSPMRGKEYLEGKGCDFMLCNLLGAKQVSIGTMIELGWADLSRTPVVLVMEPSGNIHEHAFVRQLAGYRVDSLEAGLDLIGAAMAPRRAA